MTEPESDEADFSVAMDILDLKLKCIDIAAQENLEPESTLVLAKYYFDHLMTGLIVPYPIDTAGKPKPKLKAAK